MSRTGHDPNIYRVDTVRLGCPLYVAPGASSGEASTAIVWSGGAGVSTGWRR